MNLDKLLAISGGENADWPMERLMDLCKRTSIYNVELWYPWNFKDLSISETKELLIRNGIDVPIISVPATVLGGTEKEFEIMLEAVRVANQLNAGAVNIYYGHGSDPGHAIFKSKVLILIDAAEDCVRVCIENEFDAFGKDPFHTDVTRTAYGTNSLIESVNGKIGLTCDPCNALFAGQDPLKYVRSTSRHITNLHFKDGTLCSELEESSDWKSYIDSGNRYQCCMPGEGAVPWKEILTYIDVNKINAIVLEPHAKTVRAFERAIFASRDYITRVFR